MFILEIHGDESELNLISLMHWLQKLYENALIASQDQAWSMVHFDLLFKREYAKKPKPKSF